MISCSSLPSPVEVTTMSASWARPSLSRRGLLGLVVVLVTVLAIAVAATEPAGGQAPLACDGGLYITTGAPDDMTLTRVDQATGALTPIGDGGLVANALGHNQRWKPVRWLSTGFSSSPSKSLAW